MTVTPCVRDACLWCKHFVQGNHGLTSFSYGMQQICAGGRLAERKNGEQTVADKFQYFPAMSRNRLRHRVEIAVQKIGFGGC